MGLSPETNRIIAQLGMAAIFMGIIGFFYWGYAEKGTSKSPSRNPDKWQDWKEMFNSLFEKRYGGIPADYGLRIGLYRPAFEMGLSPREALQAFSRGAASIMRAERGKKKTHLTTT